MSTASWWRRESLSLRAGGSRVGIAVLAFGLEAVKVGGQNPMAEPKGKVQVVSNDRGVVINNAATYRISKVRCTEYLHTEFIKSILEASGQNRNNLQTAFANFIPHHHQQAKTGSRWSSTLMNDTFSDFPCDAIVNAHAG